MDDKEIKKLLQDIASKLNNSNIKDRLLSKRRGIYFKNTKDDEFISVDQYVFDGIGQDYLALICTRKGSVYFEVENNMVKQFNTLLKNEDIITVLKRTLCNTEFSKPESN